MPRIAFHLQIQEGKRDEYREKHKNVPEYLEETYLDSGADVEIYSVFEKDGHVFGFMKVEDPETIQYVMESSQVQSEWNEVMNSILVDSTDTIWMDEVYRMI